MRVMTIDEGVLAVGHLASNLSSVFLFLFYLCSLRDGVFKMRERVKFRRKGAKIQKVGLMPFFSLLNLASAALGFAFYLLNWLSFQANPHNYDAWFDYLRLVESDAEAEAVREVYERAIANVPPIQEKRHWKRYIYLWINYALYEELEAKVKKQNYVSAVNGFLSSVFTAHLLWIFMILETRKFSFKFLQASVQAIQLYIHSATF